MSKKAQYNTKQMTELLSYLKSKQGIHITVTDVGDYFKSQGIAVGTTTIYRHLERMVKEGTVKKYYIDSNTRACFEYIGDEQSCNKPVCFHCKCENCGKLIHLSCKELDGVLMHLHDDHGFEVDTVRTVFYGLCEDCKNLPARDNN